MNNSNSSYIYLKPEDIRLISFILIIFWLFYVVILIAMGNTIKSASLLAILGIVTLGVLITIQISIYRHLEEIFDKKYQLSARKRGELYRQTEALFSIFSVLKTELLLPSMGKYTINPDFAKVIIDNILQSKPSVILEMGSGVSTIMAAYALKNLGLGKIVSLEHDSEFAEKNRKKIIDRGLEEFAEVLYAPLQKQVYEQKEWLWYDTSTIEDIEHIDMAIVDGPPRNIQEMSRYPALPILFKKLSHNSIIIVDDLNRKDMKKVTDLWLSQFNEFEAEIIDTKSGCLILCRKEALN